MENKEFLDKKGLEYYHKKINAELDSRTVIVDGETIVRDANGVISAKINYIPTIDTSTESLVFDSSPTYVIKD